jgi:hypothetical protein
MGFGPLKKSSVDKIFLPFGCPNPLVVRPIEGGEKFALVGYCYIYGMMEGEVMAELEQGKRKTTEIGVV